MLLSLWDHHQDTSNSLVLSISQLTYRLLIPDVLQVVWKHWKVNCRLLRAEQAYMKEDMEL